MYNVKPFNSFKYKPTKIKALNVVTYEQRKLLLSIIRPNHKVRLSARVQLVQKSLSFTALVWTRQKEAFSTFQNFFLLVVRAICHDLRKTNRRIYLADWETWHFSFQLLEGHYFAAHFLPGISSLWLYKLWPPSTTMVIPVMNDAAGDSRKHTAGEI